MTGEHLIIKSRTIAAELQKTSPRDAQKLYRMAERLEALRLAQYKLHRVIALRGDQRATTTSMAEDGVR